MRKQAVVVSHRLSWAVFAVMIALGAGCTGGDLEDRDDQASRDAGIDREADADAPRVDAGERPDAADQPDASWEPDAPVEADSGWAPEPDSGSYADAGTSPEPDSGWAPEPDSGSYADAGDSEDAGSTPDSGNYADAGPAPAPDAGPAPTPDAGTPPNNTPSFLTRSDTRAMWLWADADTSKAFLDNRWQMQDDLMQFAAAPHGQPARALNRIFFEARTYSRSNIYDQIRPITYDPLLTATEQPKLRSFLRRANAQGVAVEYLDGQAIWLATDANAQVPMQVCRDVVTFNLTTTDNAERLAGIHFDIEPHVVQGGPWGGDWWSNKLPNGYNADWTRRWKEIMNSCRATLDAYETQTGHRMTLTVDLGADYAFYNKPILDFFNGPNTPVDYVTLMNYYDNRPNQNGQPSFFHGWHDGHAVTGGVEQNLQFWTNVPVLFGMETGPTGIAADYMSFYQEGYTTMYGVVDTLTTNYANTNSLGVAIHPWGSYVPLQP